jgi:hypothetical protein
MEPLKYRLHVPEEKPEKVISEEDYLKECLKLLDAFRVDYSTDTILLDSGDLSCIMNPTSQWYELFGGHSIWGVAEFVAKKLNKKVIFRNEDY